MVGDMIANLFLTALLLSWIVNCVDAIGCFKCTSTNHNNPECEDNDPEGFSNTGRFYEEDCWAPRTDRMGLFPGTQCIKMIAEDEATNFTLVVRNCVVDGGGTNSETEIGRQSHCGWVREIDYNQKRMKGCILTCDTDGCNHGNRLMLSPVLACVIVSLSALVSGLLRVL